MPKILLGALLTIILLAGCAGKTARSAATLPFSVTAGAVKGTRKVVEPTVKCAATVTGSVLGAADKAVKSKSARTAAGYALAAPK
jgi:hypothetical protein